MQNSVHVCITYLRTYYLLFERHDPFYFLILNLDIAKRLFRNLHLRDYWNWSVTMPKVPETTRLQRFKSEFSGLDIRNGQLFCRFCEKKVSFF